MNTVHRKMHRLVGNDTTKESFGIVHGEAYKQPIRRHRAKTVEFRERRT